MTYEELGISTYPQYFLLPHWFNLKDKYIFTNPKAVCWICTRKNVTWEYKGKLMSNLLLHHVSYENLGEERYLVDIFILCQFCHEEVHFWGYGAWKTPLKKPDLLRRMYYLKGKNCYQKGRVIPSSIYFLVSALY